MSDKHGNRGGFLTDLLDDIFGRPEESDPTHDQTTSNGDD